MDETKRLKNHCNFSALDDMHAYAGREKKIEHGDATVMARMKSLELSHVKNTCLTIA